MPLVMEPVLPEPTVPLVRVNVLFVTKEKRLCKGQPNVIIAKEMSMQ